MKMHKNIFVGFMALCVASPALADNVSNLKSDWGNPAIQKCAKEFAGDFCIQSVCKNENNINVYLAKTIRANGVEFCPGMFDYDRPSNSDRPYLKSWYAKGKGQDDCFWLCKPGFGGRECSADYSGAAVSCDAIDIPKFISDSDESDEHGLSVGFDYFQKEHYDCGGKITAWDGATWKEANKNSYHYSTLGIKKLLSHGAIVQAVTARAAGRRNKKDTGLVIVVPTGTETYVLCKNGYTANADNSDCVPIDSVLCDTTPICNGWDHEIFKDREMYKRQNAKEKYVHISKIGAERSCIQYRCAQSGYGFAGDPTATDDAGRACVACPPDGYYGAISPNGRCEMSPLEDGKGVEYDENGNVVQFELEKTRKRDMINKTGGKFNKPCWQYLVDDEDEFRNCLALATASSSLSGGKSDDVVPSNVPKTDELNADKAGWQDSATTGGSSTGGVIENGAKGGRNKISGY